MLCSHLSSCCVTEHLCKAAEGSTSGSWIKKKKQFLAERSRTLRTVFSQIKLSDYLQLSLIRVYLQDV